jgi:hypothetical protein
MNAHHGSKNNERHEGRRKNWLTQLTPDVEAAVVGITVAAGRTAMKSPEMMTRQAARNAPPVCN